MMYRRTNRKTFEEMVFPHLKILLQFSLRLTENGRDAGILMQESIAEADRSWDESLPEEGCKTWLHMILIRRFCNGFQRNSNSSAPNSGDNVDRSLVRNNRLFNPTTGDPGQPAFPTGESQEDIDYFRAIAGLPSIYRSAVILSYLEGFSNKEIADLAGVQPHAVESLLNRGREYLREELFAHLMGSDSVDRVAERVRRKRTG